VKAVKPEDTTYAVNVATFKAYLKTIVFEPGTFKGKKVDQYLPIELYVPVNRRVPEIIYPIDPRSDRYDRRLYERALRLNGIEPPRLDYFPSYNYVNSKEIDNIQYPFALFKLDLDAEGQPTAIEPVKGTSGSFMSQIQTAINWGKYRPLYVNNKPCASRNFLLVSFLPQIHYPAFPIDLTSIDSLALRERVRVRLLYDTLGQVSGPLPANIINNEFVCPENLVRIIGETSYRIAIDTLGKVKLLRTFNNHKEYKKAGQALMPHLQFFPAMDIQGRAQPFEGFIKVTFNGTKKVLIVFPWLQ
ncbi:MAG: hypothetical protein ACOYVF_09200, partial [Candidatus Zixiibacteriota bacterium]